MQPPNNSNTFPTDLESMPNPVLVFEALTLNSISSSLPKLAFRSDSPFGSLSQRRCQQEAATCSQSSLEKSETRKFLHLSRLPKERDTKTREIPDWEFPPG